MKAEFKNKGFGIIEILVAIGLSAFVLTAFLSLTWQTVKINQANIKELRARMHLKELIEIAKDLERSATSTIFAENYSCPECYPATTTSAQGLIWELKSDIYNPTLNGEYPRWISIIDVDQNVKDVKAEIEWHDGFKDRQLSLETRIYKID